MPPAHARRALKALVQADTFERFLAANFPASKVRRYAPLQKCTCSVRFERPRWHGRGVVHGSRGDKAVLNEGPEG